jgi:ElaA protein
MKFQWQTFPELNTQTLYDLLALREDVFQINQQCLYTDLDYQDQHALHLLAFDGGKLAGYLRLFTPDSAKDLQSTPDQAGAYTDSTVCRFGRFVTSSAYRGQGLGKKLADETLRYCKEHYPKLGISIAAQQYLEKFYQDFGFVTQGKPYDDFGIPHIDMLKSPSQ